MLITGSYLSNPLKIAYAGSILRALVYQMLISRGAVLVFVRLTTRNHYKTLMLPLCI